MGIQINMPGGADRGDRNDDDLEKKRGWTVWRRGGESGGSWRSGFGCLLPLLIVGTLLAIAAIQ